MGEGGGVGDGDTAGDAARCRDEVLTVGSLSGVEFLLVSLRLRGLQGFVRTQVVVTVSDGHTWSGAHSCKRPLAWGEFRGLGRERRET